MKITFGSCGLSLIVPGFFCRSFINLSTERFETCLNSTLTSPCLSFREEIFSFLHRILISAIARRLETSSGIGPKRSFNSPSTESNSAGEENGSGSVFHGDNFVRRGLRHQLQLLTELCSSLLPLDLY